MKKFLLILVGFLIGLVAYGVADYFNVVPHNNEQPPKEEQVFVEDGFTPVFNDVNQFINYVAELRENTQIDSILTSAPPDVIQNIAVVCIKKYGSIDRHTFLQEYSQNYSNVYKFLQEPTPQVNTQPTAPPAPNEGGNQVMQTDTLASAAIIKQGTTKIEVQ